MRPRGGDPSGARARLVAALVVVSHIAFEAATIATRIVIDAGDQLAALVR